MREHLKVAGAFMCLFIAYLIQSPTPRAPTMFGMVKPENTKTIHTIERVAVDPIPQYRQRLDRAHRAAVDLYDMAAVEHLRARQRNRDGLNDASELVEHEAKKQRDEALELLRFLTDLQEAKGVAA